jgi:hypothetical protein
MLLPGLTIEEGSELLVNTCVSATPTWTCIDVRMAASDNLAELFP